MTNRYVRSTDGNDADSGATWALAKQSLAGASAIDAAGDTIWVSQAHDFTAVGAVITYAWAGSLTAPTRIICGDDSAEPPTAKAATAAESISGNGLFSLYSSINTYVYHYGLTFNAGDGNSSTNSINMQGKYFLDTCNLILRGTVTGPRIACISGDVLLKNCGYKFGHAGQGLSVAAASVFKIRGGSLLAGGTSPTTLFPALGENSIVEVDGLDLSNADAAINIFAHTGSNKANRAAIVNSLLPASWSGALVSGTLFIGAEYEMRNCLVSGGSSIRYRKTTQFGDISDDAVVYRSAGATDGTSHYSLKMASNANCVAPTNRLELLLQPMWNTATGSAKTLTVEILRDSLTNLQDSEIYLEAEYRGSSGSPLSALTSDGTDTPTAAADQDASAAAWTTTGLTNPNAQKLSVTFTPQAVGWIQPRVVMVKASTTVYVDPKPALA